MAAATSDPGATSGAGSPAAPKEPVAESTQLDKQDEDGKEKTKEEEDDDDKEYPTGARRSLIVFGLALSLFTFSLDETIVSTAVPTISNSFGAIEDVGWYGSAYVIAACALQLTFGKLYTLFPLKWVYMASMAIFELGAIVGGTAQSSLAVIMGRLVSGIGASGIAAGAFTIIVDTVPLAKRPLYLSGFSSLYTIAAVVGPIVGGALTQHVTWRWVFFINLPLGGATILAILFCMPSDLGKSLRGAEKLSFKAALVRLDVPGSILLVGSVTSLLLATQWGGSKYAWSDGRIIALFVVFGVVGAVFIFWCYLRKDKAVLPLRILTQRSVAAGSWYTIWMSMCMGVLVYYLPTYFQAIKSVSPTNSGLLLLGMLLSTILFSIIAGIVIQIVGYPVIGCIVAGVVCPLGAGLLSTLTRSSSTGMIIGYQIIFGFGFGMGSAGPVTLAQAVLPAADVATGTALMVFWQTLGVSIAIAVGKAVFLNKLTDGLQTVLPGVSMGQLLEAGVTTILDKVPPALLDMGYRAYEQSIRAAFLFSVGAACASIFGTAFMEWKNVRTKKKEGKGGSDGGESGKAGESEKGRDEENETTDGEGKQG